jgi:glyoxylase I family protein
MSNRNPILGDGGIHHVALRVKDFEKSIRFYSDLLGCVEKVRWNESPKRIALLDTGNGSYVELFENGTKSPTPEDAFWHIAFRVADADAALERCRAAGCEVYIEPKTLANLGGRGIEVRLAFCKGPDGELIEFFQSDGL